MESEEVSLSFVELCYGVLFQPKETFRRIADNPPIINSTYIVLVVGVMLSLANVFVGVPAALEQMTGVSKVPDELFSMIAALTEPRVLVLTGLAGLVFSLLWWFVYSAIYHLLAELLGGQGSARGVLTVTGLAHLPKLFIIPVSTAIYAVNGPESINSWISLVLFIYTGIYLPILGISQVHQFSLSRAMAVVLVPIGMIIFSIIFFVLISFGVFAQQFGSAF